MYFLSRSFQIPKEAEAFFRRHVAPEQKDVLEILSILRDEIQEETRSQKRTSVILTSITATGSIVVIGAVVASPFTAGSSLALTPYGGSTVVISMFLNKLLKDTKESRVLKKLVFAEEKLFFILLHLLKVLSIFNDGQ